MNILLPHKKLTCSNTYSNIVLRGVSQTKYQLISIAVFAFCQNERQQTRKASGLTHWNEIKHDGDYPRTKWAKIKNNKQCSLEDLMAAFHYYFLIAFQFPRPLEPQHDLPCDGCLQIVFVYYCSNCFCPGISPLSCILSHSFESPEVKMWKKSIRKDVVFILIYSAS